jgi:flavin-dependent dehydrogenase
MTINNGSDYDVLVTGGGVSGSVAATAAARCGACVPVIGEQGLPGGSLTAMGAGPMMSFHNPAGGQVVRGIAGEIIARLGKRGASTGHIAGTGLSSL